MIFAVIGAMMGSFACCQVRRIWRKERGLKGLGKWSVCEKCGKRLKVRENIPVISWLVQRGKCTKCGARIGVSEFLSEIGLMGIFGALGYVFWRDFWVSSATRAAILGGGAVLSGGVLSGESAVLSGGNAVLGHSGGLGGALGAEWASIAVWILLLVAVVLMWMITIYDAKWGKMPTKLLVSSVICAILIRFLAILSNLGGFAGLSAGVAGSGGLWNYLQGSGLWAGLRSDLWSLAGAMVILPGLYLVLYLVSRGKLVGDGDWLLALAIALIFGNWWLAFFVLFLSNTMASVVGVATIIRDRKKAANGKKGVEEIKTFGKEMTLKIPFGPYLVLATVAVMIFAPLIQSLLVGF